MKSSLQKLQLGILIGIASTICLAGTLWAPHIQVWGNHQIFLRSDSLVWLGAAGLAGLLASVLAPPGLFHLVESFAVFIRRFFIPLAVLFFTGLLAGLYLINQRVLHSFLGSADEHSCYFLAECIRMGRWWVEPHPMAEFFNVVHVGNRDGKWFSVYPPGWPLIYAVGLNLGVQDWLNPVMASLSLILLYLSGKKVFGFTVSWTAVLFTALAPFFLFTSASYFSHSTSLLTVAGFLYSYLRWRESSDERQRIFWAALCALITGYGLLTRYLTTAAVMAPFAGYHLIRIFKTKEEKWGKSETVFAVVLIFMMGLVLAHNFAVTGKLFKAPNKYDKSWERLGFRDDYTPIDGLIFIAARVFYLADWTPAIFCVFYFISLFQTRNAAPIQKLFQYSIVSVAAAYFLYFSWGGNQFGPRYYYEGFPFILFSIFFWIKQKWTSPDLPFRKFVTAALIVSLANSFYLIQKQGAFYDKASSQRKALYAYSEQTLQTPSIVFIQGFLGQELVMSTDDAIRNSPRMDARVLYARDLGEKNSQLRVYFPNREFYKGWYDRDAHEARLEKLYL